MKILIAIFSLLAISILWVKQSLSFTDVNKNTASFTDGIIWTYKDPLSRQALGNVANNTAYNWRRSDQNLFIENDTYTAVALSSDRTYDTTRDYRSKYLKIELGLSTTIFTMPFGIISSSDALTTEWIQLTTTFQTLPQNGLIQIRAETSGGFTIRVTGTSIVTRYLLGSITESRLVAGA